LLIMFKYTHEKPPTWLNVFLALTVKSRLSGAELRSLFRTN